jgi:hypothetical protein
MSFIDSLNLKKIIPRKLSIKLAINTFSGSAVECYQSQMALNLFKQKNIELTEICDINQELIFEKENSK